MPKTITTLLPYVLLAILVAVHALWLVGATEPAYASPDASGYYPQASLLVNEGRTWYEPETPVAHIGVHWLEAEDGRFFSRYPVGFGVLLALPYALLGPEAALCTSPILASLTLVFLFLLCRAVVGDTLAFVAALLLAVNPLANWQALWGGAHTAVAFFLVAGLWLLDRWARRPTRAAALVAGLCLGVVPTLRYPEALAGIGVAIFLVVHARRGTGSWTHLGFALLGAALPIVPLLVHNHLAFGAFWKTGYWLTEEQQFGTAFQLDFFADKWRGFVEGFMSPSSAGLFFALGLAGLAGMCVQRATRPLAFGILGVVVPISLLYMAYYWGQGGQGGQGPAAGGSRFLVPLVPLLLLPALWFLRLHGARSVTRAALGVLVLAQVGLSLPDSVERVERESAGARRMAAAVAGVRTLVPEGSVVVADRSLQGNLMYYGKWKLVDAGFLRGQSGRGPGARFGRGGEGRANPRQEGKAAKLRAGYEGLSREDRALTALEDIEKMARGHDVYWVGDAQGRRRFEDDLLGAESFAKVDEIALPVQERRAEPRGRPAAFRGPMRARGRRGGPGPGGGRFGLRAAGNRLEVFKLAR